MFNFIGTNTPVNITFNFGGNVYAVAGGDTLSFQREEGTYNYTGRGDGYSTSGTVTISSSDIGTTKTIYPEFSPTVTPL